MPAQSPSKTGSRYNPTGDFRRHRALRSSLNLFVITLALFTGSMASAGTIVRVSTTVGDFSMELHDATTWRTVQNFLGYLRGEALDSNGAPLGSSVNYNQTYLHRTQSADTQGIGIIQGGAFRFTPFVGPESITQSSLVPTVINEPQFSNTRGTIAMAKLAGDPDSASYQWFFNTVDNSNPLDTDNGGFTVFGKVLGGADGSDLEAGMAVLDTIEGLQKYRACSVTLACPRADFAPIITETYGGKPDEEFVFVAMEVVDRYSQAVNLFNPSSLQILTSIHVDGTVAYNLKFAVGVVDDQVVLEPRADTLLLLRDAPVGAAVFDSATSLLTFPVIELSESDNLCNVEFQLTDPEALRFTLVSAPESC